MAYLFIPKTQKLLKISVTSLTILSKTSQGSQSKKIIVSKLKIGDGQIIPKMAISIHPDLKWNKGIDVLDDPHWQ